MGWSWAVRGSDGGAYHDSTKGNSSGEVFDQRRQWRIGFRLSDTRSKATPPVTETILQRQFCFARCMQHHCIRILRFLNRRLMEDGRRQT